MDHGLFFIVFGLILSILLGFAVIRELFFKRNNRSSVQSRPVLKSTTPKDGVQVDTLKAGSGPEVKSGSKVQVHYTAWLEDGRKVDSSYDKGEVFFFTVGRNEVIPGWEAGMIGMQPGEIRKFTISPENAYGEKGKANVPPNAMIIFEVELLKLT